ncbi:MAG: MerR family transcriptional regulator [Deltaproteobacteria bacterium]|nr:MerR family transcriptional regulator [Deltaproteobacteria bacterium]
MTAPEEKGGAEPEYTIDELAAVSRVPSRTIRFYQSAGALPRPQIRGRVAYYGPVHVERLKLVADLQDRGLRIKAICDLLGKIEKGELDLNEWLGFEAQLAAPWANDTPRVVTEEALQELAGGRRPGVLGELLRLKLVTRQGESFLIRSPGLLQVAMGLLKAGVDLEIAVGGASIIRKHTSRAARELADYFFKHMRDGFGRAATPEELRETFRVLRPLAQEALRLIFGQEMERVLRGLVESGKAIAIPRRVATGSGRKSR